MITGLAKSIRVYFQKHPFAIVGVKGRAKGTPVEEIIQQIEVELMLIFFSNLQEILSCIMIRLISVALTYEAVVIRRPPGLCSCLESPTS